MGTRPVTTPGIIQFGHLLPQVTDLGGLLLHFIEQHRLDSTLRVALQVETDGPQLLQFLSAVAQRGNLCLNNAARRWALKP